LEAIVTLDVGPRIISFKTPDAENVLKNYDAQLGKSGELEWMIRGGHRIWLAPEDEKRTYILDNSPVPHEIRGDTIVVENPPSAPWHVKKQLEITLAENDAELTLLH